VGAQRTAYAAGATNGFGFAASAAGSGAGDSGLAREAESAVCARCSVLRRARPFLRPFGYLIDCPGSGLGCGGSGSAWTSMSCRCCRVPKMSSMVIAVAKLMSIDEDEKEARSQVRGLTF
jgi:hypothetical protein